MPREIVAKAVRLVQEGRVALEDESEAALYFRVRGDGGDHLVRLAADNRFSCTCAYWTFRGGGGRLCSHVVAALLVRAREEASGERAERRAPP